MPADDTLKSLLCDLERGLPPTRIAAARKLGEVRGNADVVAALRKCITRDTDTAVRVAAVRSLGQLSDPTAVPILLQALDPDQRTLVRIAAAQELGKLGGAEALRALGQISEPYSTPGRAARECLRELLGTKTAELFFSLRSADLRQARRILQALQEHGTPEDLQRLVTLTDLLELGAEAGKLLAETIIAIARRHPGLDPHPIRWALQKQALLHEDAQIYQSALRELDTLTGASFPVPLSGGVPASHLLPRPSGSTPTLLSAPNKDKRGCPVPDPALKNRLRYALGIPLTVLCLAYFIYLSQQNNTMSTFLFFPIVQLLFALYIGCQRMYRELPREMVECHGPQLRLHRRLGPLCWTHTRLLVPETQVVVVPRTEAWWEKSPLKWKLTPHITAHLAIMGAGHQPFRFAHGRPKEELERLASEINLYLDAQSETNTAPSISLESAEVQSQILGLRRDGGTTGTS